ncbi:MAG: hypothetical protein GY842_18935 [bacterium]|nr:hypothetical protein [bacterium]
MLFASRSTWLAVGALAIAGVSGCAAPKRTYQPSQNHGPLPEIEFVHFLSDLPAVSMDEAYHAMLLLAGDDSSGQSFAERESRLIERGVARPSWGLAADDCLDQGTLAYMIVRTCHLPGGLNDAMFGSWGLGDRRYALRTAVWHEMMPYTLPYHVVTGGELLATISKAAEYMELEDAAALP